MLRLSMRRHNMGLGDAYVKKIFDTVSGKYDMMNDVLSLGVHRLWKKELVNCCVQPLPGGMYLDVAGGTGDVAFRITDAIRAHETAYGAAATTSDSTRVVVCDINEKMIDAGRRRAEEGGYFEIDWVCGSGEDLPFNDESFDSYTNAFGIRNFSDRPKALREAHRVLKVGGVMNILEFSKVNCSLMRTPYELWSRLVIPRAGKMLADEESYCYLVQSIRSFPDQETFAAMIRDAGFGYVRYQNLTCGIACIHTAVKTANDVVRSVNLQSGSSDGASSLAPQGNGQGSSQPGDNDELPSPA